MTLKKEIYDCIKNAIVVDVSDLMEISRKILNRKWDYKYLYKKYLFPLLREGLLRRVRRGLYVEPTEFKYLRYKYQVLISKLAGAEGFLGYSSALRIYGAYKLFRDNVVTVCVPRKSYFKPFVFDDVRFESIIVDDTRTNIEEMNIGDFRVRISTKERTFVDCIDSPKYVGGWGLTFKSIRNLRGVDLRKVLKIIQDRNKQILVRKTGLLLEVLAEESFYYDLNEIDRLLDTLESMVEGTPKYLGRKNTWSSWIRVDPWKLYIKTTFEPSLRQRASTDPIFT